MTPFFAFPTAVRNLIYTTNAIESLHVRLRKIIKTHGHVPNDEAASKLLRLAIQNTNSEPDRPGRSMAHPIQSAVTKSSRP